MRLALAILVILSLSLAGCSLLTANINLTPEQQASAIKSLARTGTFIALTEIYDDKAKLREKAIELKTPIERDVLPLLRDGAATFDSTTIRLLQSKIDRRYAIYIQQSIDLLLIYYKLPEPGELMSPESLLLWEALFQGILEGADQAILMTDDQASIFLDPTWAQVGRHSLNPVRAPLLCAD